MRWCGVLLFGLTTLSVVPAQTVTENASTGQNAPSGQMTFEVASVREDKEALKPSSFALSVDESFESPKGHFHADFALPTYIEFAYKVWLTDEERKLMLAHLPDWVAGTRFAIQATAPPDATKDQYRLMMQSLLAERFGLKVHIERRELPVLAIDLPPGFCTSRIWSSLVI